MAEMFRNKVANFRAKVRFALSSSNRTRKYLNWIAYFILLSRESDQCAMQGSQIGFFNAKFLKTGYFISV